MNSVQRISIEDFEQDDSFVAELVDGSEKTNVCEDFDEEDNWSLSPFVKIKANPISWLKDSDLPHTTTHGVFPPMSFSKYREMSAVEIFELSMTENVFQLLVGESNRYGLFVNFPHPKITLD